MTVSPFIFSQIKRYTMDQLKFLMPYGIAVGSFLQNGPKLMLLSILSSALAGFIPGVLGLWCALKVVSKLPVEDWWEDIQHLAVTEGICTLVSMTVIGFLAIPFILIKRYELTCGGVLPVFSLYVIISWVGSFMLNMLVGGFLPDPMQDPAMLELQQQFNTLGGAGTPPAL